MKTEVYFYSYKPRIRVYFETGETLRVGEYIILPTWLIAEIKRDNTNLYKYKFKVVEICLTFGNPDYKKAQ